MFLISYLETLSLGFCEHGSNTSPYLSIAFHVVLILKHKNNFANISIANINAITSTIFLKVGDTVLVFCFSGFLMVFVRNLYFNFGCEAIPGLSAISSCVLDLDVRNYHYSFKSNNIWLFTNWKVSKTNHTHQLYMK